MRYSELITESMTPAALWVNEGAGPMISRGRVIWFNPQNRDFIQSDRESHGTLCFKEADWMGLPKDTMDMIWDKNEDDVYAFLRELIQMSGKVRISLGFRGEVQPSIEAATVRTAHQAATFLSDAGLIRDRLHLDIGGKSYVLDGHKLSNFIRFGR